MKTLIYLTDNSLAEPIASKCRELLVREAKDIPIVSVSQEPIELGLNVCVGKIGRSWLSLYKQMMAGLEAVKTSVSANTIVSTPMNTCRIFLHRMMYFSTIIIAGFYNGTAIILK
jgi:hypothetical protein